MFSGIIETLASVTKVTPAEHSIIVEIATGFPDLELGESVAVNGVCLTVVTFDAAGLATFYVSSETIARSSFSALKAGASVNLERSVRLETRLSGHLVQGHVDGKAVLIEVVQEGETYHLTVGVPTDLAKYCIEKGSISLNGISLTLNRVDDEKDNLVGLGLTIIPHTWEHTNLHTLTKGDPLNVEVDVIAKYVESLCHAYLSR